MAKKSQASLGRFGSIILGAERTAVWGWSKTRIPSTNGEPEREESQYWVANGVYALVVAILWLVIMTVFYSARQ